MHDNNIKWFEQDESHLRSDSVEENNIMTMQKLKMV